MNPTSRLLVQIGRKVRDLRKARGLTQEVLAEQADLHVVYVGEIERGEANVSVGVLERIAKALGVRVVALFPYNTPQKATTQSEVLAEEILDLILSQSPRTKRILLAALRTLTTELKRRNR